MNGNIVDDKSHKSKIVQFLNLGDFSIYTDSRVPVDEPLFESIPTMITFSDYQPLQIKDKLFKLRNKDKFARRIKIIQPDSRLF
jgi:hydrocephalus-inducing protein